MNVVVILGAAAVIGSFFLAWWAVSSATPAAVDLGTSSNEPDDLRTQALNQGASRRLGGPILERLGRFVQRWAPNGRIAQMNHKLDSAGSPERWTVERLLGVKVVSAAVLGVLVTLLVMGDLSLLGMLMIVAAALGGFLLPDLILNRKITERNDAIKSELSAVIDQLSMMVQAGLGIDAAIARAAKSSEGPLADEFTRVGHDVRVGVERSVALANLADRVDVPELNTFVAALSQAERLGAPVAQTLQIQAEEIRLKRAQHAEEQAMKLPVKLLFPMVLCILPVLMIVILAPAAITIFEQF